jgi:hypothetical protein
LRLPPRIEPCQNSAKIAGTIIDLFVRCFFPAVVLCAEGQSHFAGFSRISKRILHTTAKKRRDFQQISGKMLKLPKKALYLVPLPALNYGS